MHLHHWDKVARKNDLLHIVVYVILRSGRSVMVVNRISVRNLFIEEARALGLLAFFTIAVRVAGKALNMLANLRMVMCMHSRTDNEACANANYGQLKMHKRSQNFSLRQLFFEVYKSLDRALWKQKQKILIPTSKTLEI